MFCAVDSSQIAITCIQKQDIYVATKLHQLLEEVGLSVFIFVCLYTTAETPATAAILSTRSHHSCSYHLPLKIQFRLSTESDNDTDSVAHVLSTCSGDTLAMVDASLADFQRKKCLRVFNNFFDVNGDGVVNWDDFEKVIEKFQEAYGWQRDSEKCRASLETLRRVWDGIKSCGDGDEDGKITEDEWMVMWEKCAQEREASGQLPDWQNNYMDFLFGVSDTSGDLLIDKDEFTDTYRVYGLSVENCGNTFDRISTDGAISRDDFGRLWIDYFFSADPGVKGNYLFGMPGV
ncbi:hypothetical protein LSAT2_032484 [Lamellibrachia satsuma]|nr:hypothetical protein LSAT2_032484 [Lamellibrachia satsuma]